MEHIDRIGTGARFPGSPAMPLAAEWVSRSLRIVPALLLFPLLGGSAGAQSGTVSISQARIIPAQLPAPTAAIAAMKRVAPVGACGAARVCTPGWDLRLSGLVLDDTVVAPTGKVISRMTIENRGRAASEASELRLCVASGAQCVGESTDLVIPALQSGEKLEIVQPFASYAANDVAPPYTALVRIDPDRATAESNRANNDASVRVRIEPASLTLEAFDAVPVVQNRAAQIPVNVVVRNESSVAKASAAVLQISGFCGSNEWGDSATRLAVPALGPGERWSASVAVRHPIAITNSSYGGDAQCAVRVGFSTATDPKGDRTRISRDYLLKK